VCRPRRLSHRDRPGQRPRPGPAGRRPHAALRRRSEQTGPGAAAVGGGSPRWAPDDRKYPLPSRFERAARTALRPTTACTTRLPRQATLEDAQRPD
jgi:hypothetical protein